MTTHHNDQTPSTDSQVRERIAALAAEHGLPAPESVTLQPRRYNVDGMDLPPSAYLWLADADRTALDAWAQALDAQVRVEVYDHEGQRWRASQAYVDEHASPLGRRTWVRATAECWPIPQWSTVLRLARAGVVL